MHESYTLLAAALRERIAVIADRALYERDPAAHLEKLKAASEAIVTHGDAIPLPMDGEFAHFLQRASYAKALDWLAAKGL
jgi:hypothetical protein